MYEREGKKERKETCISAKEPYISAKESYKSTS